MANEIKNLKTNIGGLEQRFLGTLRPTAEETGAEQQLSNLMTSQELGLRKAADQPIAQPFVTGQQAAITERTAIQTRPLQERLALLQKQRQTSADVLRTQLGFEKEKLASAEDERLRKESLEREDELREEAKKDAFDQLFFQTFGKTRGKLSRNEAEKKLSKAYESEKEYENELKQLELASKRKSLSGGGTSEGGIQIDRSNKGVESLIEEAVNTGDDWGTIAATLNAAGINVGSGSHADKTLRKIFLGEE